MGRRVENNITYGGFCKIESAVDGEGRQGYILIKAETREYLEQGYVCRSRCVYTTLQGAKRAIKRSKLTLVED